MKLAPRDLPGFIARPEPGRAGILLYGTDAMRVSLRRQALLKALVGETGDEEMRLTRLNGPDLRRDPAALMDAMKAISMYPGPRAVHVEGATDQAAPAVTAALEEWREGDATLVITAGSLAAKSALRKAFPGDHLFDLVDITDQGAVSQWADSITNTFPRLDFLVNNAAVVNRPVPFWDLSPGEMEQLAALIDPQLAIITAVGPAHLEELGDLNG